jgi:hypothetical protein
MFIVVVIITSFVAWVEFRPSAIFLCLIAKDPMLIDCADWTSKSSRLRLRHFLHGNHDMDPFKTLTGGSRFDHTRFSNDIAQFDVRSCPNRPIFPSN